MSDGSLFSQNLRTVINKMVTRDGCQGLIRKKSTNNYAKYFLTLIFTSIFLCSSGILEHNAFADTVTTAITVAGQPQEISINPNTNMIYVTVRTSSDNYHGGTVTVIDGATNSVVSTITVGGAEHLAVNPNTNKIYESNSANNTVSVIDGSTNNIVSTISGFKSPAGIGVNPNTNKIYVANTAYNTVSVIDGATNSVVSTITVGDEPLGIGVNPNTNKIYVSNNLNTDNTVYVIDGPTNSVVSTIPVGSLPSWISVNPVTNKIYVVTATVETDVIDGVTNSVTKIPIGSIYIGVNPVTNKIYWSDGDNNGKVDIINGTTNNLITTLTGFSGAAGVGVNPNTNMIYVANSLANTVSVINGATVPQQPTGLTATAISSSQINLSWTAPSNNGDSAITGYTIERSTDSGTTWSTIVANTASTATTYSDTGLAASTTYMYRVSAINSVGTSSPSNTASATTTSTQLSLTVKSVDLSGNQITGMSTVIRYTNGTTISEGFTPVSFTVTSGIQYVVHVRNYGSNVFNHWSDGNTNSYYTITPTQNVTLTAYYSTGTTTTTVPSAPQNLQAAGGNAQVVLSWAAPSSNGGSAITGYKIYRSTSSGTEALLATTGNVVSYTDSTVTNGQTYYYKVTAVNSVGESLQSNEASATPADAATAPQSPTGLAATAASSSQINLSWTAPSNNGGSSITGYEIDRSTDSGTTWSAVQSNTGSVSTTYSDTGLAASTTYMYKVSAINSVGTSSPSNIASATTGSAPPPSTTQVTISVKSVNLLGNPITGMSTVIRYTNGTTITESFTPASFTVKSGTTYVVHVRNYGTNVFNHWQDGTTSSYFTITPKQNVTLTAYYSTG